MKKCRDLRVSIGSWVGWRAGGRGTCEGLRISRGGGTGTDGRAHRERIMV